MSDKLLNQVRLEMANFLKNKRKELGLSHAQAAELTGLSKRCIINAEQCQFWLSTKQYTIICNAYGVKPFNF